MTSFPVILSLRTHTHTHGDRFAAADSFFLHLISKGESAENGWMDGWLIEILLLLQHFLLGLISALLSFFFSDFHLLEMCHVFPPANSFSSFILPASGILWDHYLRTFILHLSPELGPSLARGSETSEASSVTSCFPRIFSPSRAELDSLMLSPPDDGRVHRLSHHRAPLQSPLAGSGSWLSISSSASSVFKNLFKPFTTRLRVWNKLI